MAKSDKDRATWGSGFWDKPVLMNLVSDILLLASGAALAWAAILVAQRLPVFPLRQVVVTSQLGRVTPLQVEYVVREAVSGNFFLVNLDAVRGAFEKLPWVRHAAVRRRWPDTLELQVEEHAAVARWQQQDAESRLVNDHGEVFSAASAADLPLFAGPEGSAADVLKRYHEFTVVLQPTGRTLRSVSLSPRQAWQLRLDDGAVVELGREESQHLVNERMARFVAGYDEAAKRVGAPLALVDLRYPNGFAVRAAHSSQTARP